ncbi:MAG TPA: hypothetical protein VKD23_01870 [Terriglobales bacterium]|jgi:hypothetical protein|nr:hypothetical protein [Terriglobales bacterium]
MDLTLQPDLHLLCPVHYHPMNASDAGRATFAGSGAPVTFAWRMGVWRILLTRMTF